MADLSTEYLGMTLRNPIIVGSSGLATSVAKVKDLEASGAGAVVLKSLFEEEIAAQFEDVLKEATTKGYHQEAFDYYDYQIRGETLERYTELISQSKKSVSIPVIASVNCMYSHEWAMFARELQAAGADALELNMFFMPGDLSRSSVEQEKMYFDTVARVKREVGLPIALKISYYFSNLSLMIQRLSATGIGALVLFNRFYVPDIDIEGMRVMPSNVFSTPAELGTSLRWVAMMAGRVECDLVASTGIHDGKAVIKQILAGAKAVEVVSAIYKNGPGHIQTMLQELDAWMTRHGYYGLDEFRGKMSQAQSDNPSAYERAQFMKYAGGGPAI